MYRFPCAIFAKNNSIPRQLLHIASEFWEVCTALVRRDLEHAVHEAFDCIHSLETLIRIVVQRAWSRGQVINSTLICLQIEDKNRQRGYYK